MKRKRFIFAVFRVMAERLAGALSLRRTHLRVHTPAILIAHLDNIFEIVRTYVLVTLQDSIRAIAAKLGKVETIPQIWRAYLHVYREVET